MKKIGKFITAVMFACVIFLGEAASVSADSYASLNIDESKKCTVTVDDTIADEYNQSAVVKIDGATFQLVKAADLSTDGQYTPLEAFAGLDGWNDLLSSDSGTESQLKALSEKVYQIVTSDAGKGSFKVSDTQKTGADGQATLTANDGYGIYLLYQSGSEGTAKKYTNITPVLIQMPKPGENGWTYAASVKGKTTANKTSVRVRKREGTADGKASDVKVLNAKLEIVDAGGSARVYDSWTTEDVDHDSALLMDGDYLLRETEAPDGYQTADDVPFTIDGGYLYIGGKVQENNEIVMIDVKKTTPIKPTKTTDRNVIRKIAKRVKTGDASHLILWIAVIALAIVAVVVLVRNQSKKK
jgi:hypothetical protein